MNSPINDRMNLLDLNHEELVSWLAARDVRPFRAGQILRWIYLRYADSFEVMTDIGKATRKLLADHFTLTPLKQIALETSQDGSRKYLFRLTDGERIESVLIPERNHYTLCISSQVGCAQGCCFCMTGAAGFIRNLTAGEIASQVRDVAKTLPDPRSLTNIVYMGMGEPLANYSNLIRSIAALLSNEWGFGFAKRRITVSTAGLVPRIADLGKDAPVNLAVSLNATDNRTRDRLMPINKSYPIEILLDACRKFPLPPHRRITFEYILIREVNDSLDDARRLAGLLTANRAKINLIPFNRHAACQFERPEEDRIEIFRKILIDRHYTVVVRRSKGEDISAACGQLSGKSEPAGSTGG